MQEYLTRMLQLAVIIAVVTSATFATDLNEINRINNAQRFWKAETNAITENGEKYVQDLLGAYFSQDKQYRDDIEINDDIPESFDARTRWHNCKSISSIKNQGQCGSCWAISTTSALSDRLCIETNGRVQLSLSAENLLSCCGDCIPPAHTGCDGGYAAKALTYFQNTGLVTGGDYLSNEGCQPYEIAPTEVLNGYYTPPCHSTCTNKNYRRTFRKDKHFGKGGHTLPQNVAAIQSEILKNGPIVASFMVYGDFPYYTTGVYVQTSQKPLGGHAVKVLGWGVEDGVDYWLVANSWGTTWGEDGLFKIRRGTNECQFEEYMVAGLVKH